VTSEPAASTAGAKAADASRICDVKSAAPTKDRGANNHTIDQPRRQFMLTSLILSDSLSSRRKSRPSAFLYENPPEQEK
jgi:hypothetical protein